MLVGCGGESSTPEPPAPRCPVDESGAEQLYEPATAEKVELWPDPLLTTPDDTTPTGIRIDTTADKAAWIGFVAPLLKDIFVQASAASGFARNGGALFRFSEPVEGLPGTVAESLESNAVLFVDLDRGERIPFVVETSSDGRIVMLQPAVTLAPDSRHLVAVTDAVTSGGHCVASSETMAALLKGDPVDAPLDEVAPSYARGLADAGLSPDELVAATVFRTHADHLPVVAAAEHARGESFDWSTAPDCDAPGSFRHCEAAFVAHDYRQNDIVVGEPQADYTLPVTIGLPSTPGPHPVVVFGHGLGGSRKNVTAIADIAEQTGFVTVATDALRHGDHPTSTGGGAPEFLGINLGDGPGPPLDTHLLKSNFNQTDLDRLQLIQLLVDHPDIDGDGTDDIDPDHVGYWGISLGGLLGPGLLALSARTEAAVLSVGGGKLTNFVRDSTAVGDLLGLLAGLLGGPDEFEALLTVAQTMVDAGDPAMWGAHVLRDRFIGDRPHLLLPLAMFDEVVPPSTGEALARSLGLPQMRPIVEEVPPLAVVDGPLSANLDGVTAGYFQFDRVGDPPKQVGHDLPGSAEAILQARHFFETWLAGTPEIVDPYPQIGTPPL